ncbi:MAG: sensor histidine kinase [Phycisphaeraceae bacterium JB051]
MNQKRLGILNILILSMLICIGMGVAMLPLLTRDEQTSFNWLSALLALGPFTVVAALLVSKEYQIRRVRNDLFHKTTQLQRSQNQLAQIKRQLDQAAKLAGATEMATGILHNVGNVLNGVNVSVSQLAQSLRDSRMDALGSIVELMQQQGENLPQFICDDQRGKNLVEALAQLDQIRQEEAQFIVTELNELSQGVNHMRNIIDMQQSSAKRVHQYEAFSVSDVINDAIKLYANSLERLNIQLVTELDDTLEAQTDRPSVMHVLVNLISNARNAISEATHNGPRQITITSQTLADRVQVQITDTGIGIAKEHLNLLFDYGFTTREAGHGFGLHHSINAIREIGGTLTATSQGPDSGATFTLRLPAVSNVTNQIFC